MKWLWVCLEGLRFLWACRDRRWWRRPPFLPITTRAYAMWRLGTVYGIYKLGWSHPYGHPDRKSIVLDEKPKMLRHYFVDMWRDRESIVRFLLWRRHNRKRP